MNIGNTKYKPKKKIHLILFGQRVSEVLGIYVWYAGSYKEKKTKSLISKIFFLF